MPVPSGRDQDPLVVQDFGGASLVGGVGGDGISGGIGGRGGGISFQTNAYQTNNYSLPMFFGPREEGMRALYGQVATDAMHDSKEEYDRPKCHPATCKAIIDDIVDWVENDNLDYPFLWMNGPVGSGKSTIARTVAKILTSPGSHEGSFAASFFFRRTVPGRNNPSRLVATIAYQLTKHMPKVKKHITVALEKEPFVFSQSYEDQMTKLIMAPLIELADRPLISLLVGFDALLDLISGLLMQLINHPTAADNSRQRRLVIIDGLDECGGLQSQLKILEVLSKAVQTATFPLFFLIASRPEHGIRTFFNQDPVHSFSRRIVLDNEQYKLDDDIKAFLLSEFKEIKMDHPSGPSLPSDWPLHSDVQELVTKASGQFIFADTVMKFIKSPKTRPTAQLELILGATSSSKHTPFTLLDELYVRIFDSAFDPDSADNSKRALEIFSFLILRETGNLLTVGDVEEFLGYQAGDVRILLNDLHSVVNVPSTTDNLEQSAIHIYHTSLRDFLLDKNRSKDFFIDAVKGHASLTKQCVRHLSSSFGPAGPAVDSNLFKISYFDLQHHYSALFDSRDSADAHLYAFDSEAHPNLAHHKGSVDWARHKLCLLLPFHDYIRHQVEDYQSEHIFHQCLYDLDQFLHEIQAKDTAIQFLQEHIAHDAMHSSFQSEKVIIAEIEDWARRGSDAQQFFWMYGTPGRGKSTVAHSIAQMLVDEGNVVASFFFRAGAPSRKDAIRLIATIAYQISISIPKIREIIAIGIACDPCIFSRSLSVQLDTLIVHPLAKISQQRTATNSKKTISHFIVLDGLDECEHKTQVLELLSGVVLESQIPLVKFLITSRQEVEIQNFFNEPPIRSCSLRFCLDEQDRRKVRSEGQGRGGDIYDGSIRDWILNESSNITTRVAGNQYQNTLEKLHRHIAPGAIYNSIERFNAPKCYPGSRTDIFTDILAWVDDDSKMHPFSWMYGPAGTGKSSVAQTIAEILAEQGKLAATHFFSRTDAGMSDVGQFVATVAYQLALVIPAFQEPLTEAIEKDPTIFSKSVKVQLDSLIVKPFKHLSITEAQNSLGNAIPRIIVIDALDECGNEEAQHRILAVLLDAVRVSHLPLSFMISSRPEYVIRAFFDREEVSSLTRHFDLYTGNIVDRDIEGFLRSGFEDIKKTHPLKSSLPHDWPSNGTIERLVREASGQFIYASSIIKFIANAKQRPNNQLEIILGLRPSGNQTPFASLDNLYTHLLYSVDDWGRVAPLFQIIIQKLEASERITLGDIATSLHLELEELQMLLADLHSILYVPSVDQPEKEIRLYHASLVDFLRDSSRAGPFFIEI